MKKADKKAKESKKANGGKGKAKSSSTQSVLDAPSYRELGPLPDPPVPQEVHPVLAAFPARVIGTLLPNFDAIPDEFKSLHGPWATLISRWFAGVLPDDIGFHPKPGINAAQAWKHISTCLASYEPKHEHKIAGCAYLASCFFEKVASPSTGESIP